MCAYLVSRALRILLRGCCSRQLTAGFPAAGRVMALSTREVMAWTASTFIWVLSRSSCATYRHVSSVTHSPKPGRVLPVFFFVAKIQWFTSCWVSSSWSIVIGWVTSTPKRVAHVSSNCVRLLQPARTPQEQIKRFNNHVLYTKGWTKHEVCLMSTHSDTSFSSNFHQITEGNTSPTNFIFHIHSFMNFSFASDK